METKRCKQCGDVKPIECFRNYYGGRHGTYTTCKDCEKINSRAKYLMRKGVKATSADIEELDKINRLYDALRACGLQPPNYGAGKSRLNVKSIDDMISRYTEKANEVADTAPDYLDTAGTPAELLYWLSAKLDREPEYYLDEVYEELQDKYRPPIRIDALTSTVIYNEEFSLALKAVLERFYSYESDYYGGE